MSPVSTARSNKPAAAADDAATSLEASLQRLVDAAVARALTSAANLRRSSSMNHVITDRISGVAGKVKEKAVEAKEKAAEKAVGAKEKAAEVTDSVRHPAKSTEDDSGGATVIEHIDAGVPVEVAYEQWTKFGEFPEFLDPGHSQVLEEVPKERIVWRASPHKGHIDGAVTFHELAPQLARIVVVLEAHPKGIVERVGYVFRPAGRRLRGELANFQRHVMAECVLHSTKAQRAVKKRRKVSRKSTTKAKSKGAKG